MNDRIYVSPEDVQRLSNFIQKLKPIYPTSRFVQKHPMATFSLDILGGSQEIKAKVIFRNRIRNHFPTFNFSRKKIDSCRSKARAAGTKFWLFIKWSDCVGMIDLTKEDEFANIIGGRKDRGDHRDTEEMAIIPLSAITIIDGTPTDLPPREKRFVYEEEKQQSLF